MTHFARLTTENVRQLEAALAIYTESFPPNERHPTNVIRERVAQEQYSLIVGRDADELVFLALLWPLRGSEFVLLDYMATKSGHRGRGIGVEFLKSLPQMAEMAGKFLVMEVEDPDAGENREERARRVEFYRRQGALQLQGVPYTMPGLSGGAPTEMILMILPQYAGGQLDARIVRQMIVQIYNELYGRGAEDTLLLSFLNEIAGCVRLA
jgi:GNAT superfamily N-acetyltransferase